MVLPLPEKFFYEDDPYLGPHQGEIRRRYTEFTKVLTQIESTGSDLDKFTRGYEEFGLLVQNDNGILAREWAPGADGLFLKGDFNNWSDSAHPYARKEYGKWELLLTPNPDGTCPIPHGTVVKVMVMKDGQKFDKLSPWAHYVSRGPTSTIYHQIFFNPPMKYQWTSKGPQKPQSLRIYECHVGISSSEGKVASYRSFADEVVPRVLQQGYNSLQLMAVMEHVYYASFGYQVTSFFAPASRCGTPDDLKYLIDKAHQVGLYVMLDVVHSHASKNVADGLNQFDGTNGCYFHDNPRGFHDLWDSRLFNYTEVEVLRFLLSNLRWWIEEFHFDGFRFDGVTSMLYHSHGMGHAFNSYDDYFGLNGDTESLVYLMLANHMLHSFYPQVTTIAEEVSGMPGICRSVAEGGQGFDYRLAMAIPDMWIKLLKETKARQII